MRIEGPKTTTEISNKKSTTKTSSDGRFDAMVTGGKTEAAATRGSSLVADIGGLIAVQAADDATERQARRRMVKRGEALLKQLDAIRVGLLSGTVTLAMLSSLDALLRQAKEEVGDPRLQEILLEIEMRAEIERAKLEMAKESQS